MLYNKYFFLILLIELLMCNLFHSLCNNNIPLIGTDTLWKNWNLSLLKFQTLISLTFFIPCLVFKLYRKEILYYHSNRTHTDNSFRKTKLWGARLSFINNLNVLTSVNSNEEGSRPERRSIQLNARTYNEPVKW